MTMPATDISLTQEMIDAIQRIAAQKGVTPESVLRRAIFTYTAKYDRPALPPDCTNVVPLRGEP